MIDECPVGAAAPPGGAAASRALYLEFTPQRFIMQAAPARGTVTGRSAEPIRRIE